LLTILPVRRLPALKPHRPCGELFIHSFELLFSPSIQTPNSFYRKQLLTISPDAPQRARWLKLPRGVAEIVG
jgi:hypothetical protein